MTECMGKLRRTYSSNSVFRKPRPTGLQPGMIYTMVPGVVVLGFRRISYTLIHVEVKC